MVVYYLFVHKKSLWKRKVCIIFIKNLKFKKTQKNQKKTFLVCFCRWVFLGGFFNANPGSGTGGGMRGWDVCLGTIPAGQSEELLETLCLLLPEPRHPLLQLGSRGRRGWDVCLGTIPAGQSEELHETLCLLLPEPRHPLLQFGGRGRRGWDAGA